MLKSLFSGVSGLQSHQIAMDVESNNIANVNTIGYKYSRANFSDLLAQTSKIATAPQGDLGGKNALQVGLGTTIDSVTRIHSQGSIQNTDKNTDVAIQGDGFFIVSAVGSNTYKYSRSGDFKFDALGNFVDNNGFVVQGWLRDETTGLVDSTAPISNILIPPGLTTPAQATTQIDIKANLNSGPLVEQFGAINPIDSAGNPIDANGSIIPAAIAPNPEQLGVMFNSVGQSLALENGQGVWISYETATVTGAGLAAPGVVNIDINGTTINSGAAVATGTDMANLINQFINDTGVRATFDPGSGQIILTNDNTIGTTTATKNIVVTNLGGDATGLGGLADTTAYEYLYNDGTTTYPAPTRTVQTVEDLRSQIALDANLVSPGVLNEVDVTVTQQGEFRVTNLTASTFTNMRMNVTGATGTNSAENIYLVEALAPLSRSVPPGSFSESQPLNHATHSSSIDIFDSLGSRHTVRIDFVKVDNQQWLYTVTVPNPGEIDTVAPLNILNDRSQLINFDDTGALNSPDINFSFTANNGSQANQPITINLGSFGDFDGLTSFDRPSATSGISHDGFPGGDLLGIRIDQSGTLVGSFSNGRSFGLAQIAMAKFANNEGLVTDGGNVYLQSANSGDPIIGSAATAGRGFIQSSALEASNVDLSKSLTQLIIIQRGYQANGKTITTSDQLLETLIGLKR